MPSLTMPLADAILSAKALLNHASKDDITPVICTAAVLELDGKHYLVATDRYSFGRFRLDILDILDGDPVGGMIPRAALEWVSKITVKGLRNEYAAGLAPDNGGYSIRYQWTDIPDVPRGTDVEVAIIRDGKSERSQTFDGLEGNFPPVAKLWKDDTSEEAGQQQIILNHAAFTKIAADIALFHGKGHNGSARLNLTASTNPNRPGPVQYTLGQGAGERWTAAIQPNLELR